jgi:sensor histidine kinase YesM
MANTSHHYYGPGSNFWPAIKYLRKIGATSEEKAISLDQIESEDFRELLRLNSQTSLWIVVTPEGKYWARTTSLYLIYGLFILILLAFLFISISTFINMSGFGFSVFNSKSLFQTIEENEDEINDLADEMENIVKERSEDSREQFDESNDELQQEIDDIQQEIEENEQIIQDGKEEMGL